MKRLNFWVCVVLVGGLPFVWWYPLQPVQEVVLVGGGHRAQALTEAIIQAQGRVSFFARSDRLCEKIFENPWVRTCALRRHFPNVWQLDMQYHTPLFVIHEGAVSNKGVLIPSLLKESVGKIMKVDAPSDKYQEAYNLYRMLHSSKGLTHKVKNMGYAQKLGWWVHLEPGSTVVLGERLHADRWAYFLKVIQKPGFAKRSGQYFDMRYVSGFAYRKEPLQKS